MTPGGSAICTRDRPISVEERGLAAVQNSGVEVAALCTPAIHGLPLSSKPMSGQPLGGALLLLPFHSERKRPCDAAMLIRCWLGAAAPVEPVVPAPPVGPVAPVGPVGPVAPIPVAPVGPVGPVGPVPPLGPVGPVAPVGPVGPVAAAPVMLITPRVLAWIVTPSVWHTPCEVSLHGGTNCGIRSLQAAAPRSLCRPWCPCQPVRRPRVLR